MSSVVVFGKINLMTYLVKAKEKLNLLASKYFPVQDTIDEEMNKHFDDVKMIEIKIEYMFVKKIHER